MTREKGRATLRIEVSGMPRGSRIPGRARARIARVLAAKEVRATTALVRLTDENGPKGGDAIRCALTVKVTGRPPVHAEDVAASARLAFDAAFAKLERRLVRLKEAIREGRRRPKKYFLAAREWERAT